VVDDLSHDSFSYLVSYLQRLIEVQVQRQIQVNKKANEDSKKDVPKSERLTLIQADHVNLLLRMIILLQDTLYQGKKVHL
jgi:hypothetical protein